jgi:hypothetical protein
MCEPKIFAVEKFVGTPRRNAVEKFVGTPRRKCGGLAREKEAKEEPVKREALAKESADKMRRTSDIVRADDEGVFGVWGFYLRVVVPVLVV